VPTYEAEAWSDFAVGMAGAAAALAGLLFVAVSINLQAILAGPTIPGRAAQALVMLVSPIFLALCVLIPGQPTSALGIELIVVAAVVGAVLGRLSSPKRRSAQQPLASWAISSAVPAVFLCLCPMLAGAGVLTESLGGLYWIPPAVAVALVGGLMNAWALLIEILR